MARRSFLRTSAVLGAGAVLGSAARPAAADHTECATADRWVSSPNYGVRDEEIDWIVVHVATGTYTDAINWFQNPDSNVSTHYVVSNYEDTDYPPGHVTQMVHEEDSAWHARAIANPRSIGIELEWWDGANPEEPISEECYDALAELVRCVADRYDIPLEFYERETCIQEEDGGIIGHQHVPDGSCSNYDHDGRTCPYPDFEPGELMTRLDGTDQPFQDGDEVQTTVDLNGREQPSLDSDVVTVLPEGTTAEVMNGPETADGYTWWGLHEPEQNVWVWCVEEYLELAGEEPAFQDGDTVETTVDLNGREQPSLDSDVVTVLAAGTTAEVVNGPESADGYTWWGLHEPVENVWVWCVEEYLQLADESDSGSGGDGELSCFITTATAEEPATLHSLRRFRDESMSRTWLGRSLVGLYYRISPPIAATLDAHPASRTTRTVRSLVRRCASLSDRQAATDSRLHSAFLGIFLTVLYVVGISIAAIGHAAIGLVSLVESPDA